MPAASHCTADRRIIVAHSCSFPDTRSTRVGRELVNRSISVAGDYCERVLPLAAGVLHQQAQAVDAMTSPFRQFRNQPGSDERS